jgi:signal transduction histidine kinase
LLRARDDLEARVQERTAELAAVNKALRESEQRARMQLAELDHIYRASPVGLCLLDHNLRYLRINERLAAMNGRSVEDHLGRALRDVLPDLADRVEAVGRRVLANREPVLNVELHGTTGADPDRQRDWLASWFAVPGLSAGHPRVGMVVLETTEQKEAERRLREQAERLRDLSRQLLQVQEAERRRIARELHDEIGQVLTAVKINLQALQRTLDPSQPVPRLQESLAVVEHALQQVRNLSLDLRPSLLDDLGLVPALGWYLDRQAKRAEFQGYFFAEPQEIHLPSELATACFRVAQEAVTNIIRHAKARHVWMEVRQDDGELLLTVRDDGAGFDVAQAQERASRGGSLGVAGMQERAALLGGRVEIESNPGAGSTVRVRFPLEPGLVSRSAVS